MDAFRNGELLHSIFFFQRFLAMGRDRVMNLSTNAVTIEITLPFISAGRKDREDMKNFGLIDIIRMDSTL